MGFPNVTGRVLVTGANGFVGSALVRYLAARASVSAASRHRHLVYPDGVVTALLTEEGALSDESALQGVQVVVHCAGRAHVMRERATDPLVQFRRVNVANTLALAKQASLAGVKRFVFLSSVKVHGEQTEPNRPFRADDPPAPQDAYALSKLEAELALRALSAETGLQVVIIRMPLVYGPGVKANFHTMLRWVRAGVPLPFGALRNRRSLIALDNLVSLIEVCTWHPDAAGQVLLASDGVDLSTADLLRQLAQGMERPSRLLRVPPVLLGVTASVVGRKHLWQRLGGSLCVDMEPTRRLLGWAPPVDARVALQQTARAFVAGEGW